MTVVCLDLDRTVIYSAAALDLRIPDEEAARILTVGQAADYVAAHADDAES